MTRLAGATHSVRQALATASGLPLDSIRDDEDFIFDLGFDDLELESFELIVEEVFAIRIPENMFRSPLYRTAEAFAEWVVRQSIAASWIVGEGERKRA